MPQIAGYVCSPQVPLLITPAKPRGDSHAFQLSLPPNTISPRMHHHGRSTPPPPTGHPASTRRCRCRHRRLLPIRQPKPRRHLRLPLRRRRVRARPRMVCAGEVCPGFYCRTPPDGRCRPPETPPRRATIGRRPLGHDRAPQPRGTPQYSAATPTKNGCRPP